MTKIPATQKIKNSEAAVHALAPVLFSIYFLHLFFASSGKPLWVDEIYGINSWIIRDFWPLFVTGISGGQPSTSPLPYLLEKSWYVLWSGNIYTFWDLRVFFRIPSIFHAALASTILFSFSFYWLRKRNFQRNTSLLAALCISLFYFSNSFTKYYGQEARPYCLWYLVTTFQVIIFCSDLSTPNHGRIRWPAIFVAVLLVFTTYASLLQIYAIELTLLLHSYYTKRHHGIDWKAFGSSAAVIFPSTIVGLYYLSYFEMKPFPPATFSIFQQSVLEVVQKTWHHHGPQPLALTLPLIALACPLYWWKRKSALFWPFFLANLLLLSSFVPFAASTWKGGILAARYFIYLVPFISLSYFLALYTVGLWTRDLAESRLTKLKGFRVVIANLLFALYAGAAIWGLTKDLPTRFGEFRDNVAYGRVSGPDCLEKWNPDLEGSRLAREKCLKH